MGAYDGLIDELFGPRRRPETVDEYLTRKKRERRELLCMIVLGTSCLFGLFCMCVGFYTVITWIF